MKKQIIAGVCLAAILVSVFAACARKQFITDEEGHTHVLALDKEGNTIVDERGWLVVQNEDDTAYVTFPKYIAHEDMLETYHFKLPLPEAWEMNGDTLTKKGTEIKVYMHIRQNVSDYDAIKKKQEDDAKEMLKNGLIEKEAGYLALGLVGAKNSDRYDYVLKTDAGDFYAETYNIYAGTTLYSFVAMVPAEQKDTLNFTALLTDMKFRK